MLYKLKFWSSPLILITIGHVITDLQAGAIPIIIPHLKEIFALSYTQVGFIVLLQNLTSSVIQPLFGYITDKKSMPWILPVGAAISGAGFAATGLAPSYNWLLAIVIVTGFASASFHPQASRSINLISTENNKGKNMGIFLVGGNGGMAMGSMAMAFLVLLPGGVSNTAYFMLPAILIFIFLYRCLPQLNISQPKSMQGKSGSGGVSNYKTLALILVFIFVRSSTLTGIMTYMPMYYMQYMNATPTFAGSLVSIYLLCGAIGTLVGGTLSDRLGRRNVIVASMLLCIPLVYLLFNTGGILAGVVMAATGFCMVASFGPIVILMQDLMPNNIGMASGLTIGFSVGLGGCGVLLIGKLADMFGLPIIANVFIGASILSFLLASMLPKQQAAK